MATIVYLDVEDEITSAATRIRTSEARRVALVLPFGSRLATSRINFRLLAREALVNGRRLDIVAPDASARALAASAGLPVFASVAEYETALEQPRDAGESTTTPAGPDVASAASAPGDGAATALAAGTAGAGTAGAVAAAAGAAEAAGAGTAGAAGAGAGGARTARGRRSATPAGASPRGDGAALGTGTARLDEAPPRDRGEPRVVHAPRRRIGAGLVAGVGLLVLALAVAGVAAYLFLPSAEIVVTPRITGVGPILLTVRADPDAAAVDTENLVIPADTVSIPVETSGQFKATGKRVAQTAATGGVKWTNCDPTAAYTIPQGTTVRTASGIQFTTEEAVFLPVAQLSGTPPNVRVDCQTSEVGVTAVKPGPDGNVGAGTIKVVPARYNRTVIRVTNPSPTSGGAREEFARVSAKDVDAALEQLRKDIRAQFATELEDPANVPEGATLFPDTAQLGEAAPDTDPTTLVNQETESFTLGMKATGTVLAVDATPVEAIAKARLEGSVDTGYQLVDGSMTVTVGEGAVVGGVVSFPVEGSARQVRVLDAEELKGKVLGLGAREARDALAPYGDVRLTLWPDWVSAVPGLAQRVTLTVAPPADAAPSAPPGAGPGGSASPPGGSSAPPDGGASPGEPVPSG